MYDLPHRVPGGRAREDDPRRVEVLESWDLLGQVRLSCQALYDRDMMMRILMTVNFTGLDGPGPEPQPQITPSPEWVDEPY